MAFVWLIYSEAEYLHALRLIAESIACQREVASKSNILSAFSVYDAASGGIRCRHGYKIVCEFKDIDLEICQWMPECGFHKRRKGLKLDYCHGSLISVLSEVEWMVKSCSRPAADEGQRKKMPVAQISRNDSEPYMEVPPSPPPSILGIYLAYLSTNETWWELYTRAISWTTSI
jgi:hypothetical protein